MRLFSNFLKKTKQEAPSFEGKIASDKLSANDLEERIQATVLQLKAQKRTAYLPKTIDAMSRHSSEDKFGGLPYLLSETDWPTCEGCNRHMQLFLQLDLAKLPERASSGLLQVFYCTNKEADCEREWEAFIPDSKAVLCRIIHPKGNSSTQTPSISNIFPERRIIGWKAVEDYPHWEEYPQLGITQDVDVAEALASRLLCQCQQGDKLFGWPHWLQFDGYVSSEDIALPWNIIFQLDSNDNLPYEFAENGIAFIHQNPEKAEDVVLSFESE